MSESKAYGPFTITAFRVGQRVELHPATDAWMSGDRFGSVVSLRARGRRGARIQVRMDRSGRTLAVAPRDVGAILD